MPNTMLFALNLRRTRTSRNTLTMSRTPFLFAALFFAGCATNFEAPPLAPDHPASPEAAEARPSTSPRLVADALTRKTKAQLERNAAPDADYQTPAPRMQHDMGSMKGVGEAHAPAMHGAQKAKGYWTCLMHPEIHADKPGQCPKCGMTLVKKEGAAP
jgi:Heavy metal binding domain